LLDCTLFPKATEIREGAVAASLANLRLLDQPPTEKEFDLVSELFHRINRVIPRNQAILTVAPDCRARDALILMHKHGYSQLPVVHDGEVIGVFSYRSFAHKAARESLDDWARQKCAPGDLPVDDCIEKFEFARVTEEMSHVFDGMDRDNGILIGAPERLIGILTPMDFLRYLYRVASPFVMISEIELALRALIRFALSPEQIDSVAQRILTRSYENPEDVPTSLESMTFENYRSLISHGETWPAFEHIFGGTRTRTSGKLKEIGEIRNALFHFRREITVQDHETLAGHRDWLLNKTKQAGALRKTGAQP
jgi:predicted transcriptional regulator